MKQLQVRLHLDGVNGKVRRREKKQKTSQRRHRIRSQKHSSRFSEKPRRASGSARVTARAPTSKAATSVAAIARCSSAAASTASLKLVENSPPAPLPPPPTKTKAARRHSAERCIMHGDPAAPPKTGIVSVCMGLWVELLQDRAASKGLVVLEGGGGGVGGGLRRHVTKHTVCECVCVCGPRGEIQATLQCRHTDSVPFGKRGLLHKRGRSAHKHR